jgi:Uma2 family endonuclease
MVTTPLPPLVDSDIVDFDASPLPPDCYDKVPEGMELVDGELIEKTGMTILHSAAQGRLLRQWGNYAISSGQGGEAYPEAPCRTNQQHRRPDAAYVTAAIGQQFGHPNIFPQSFPLIGEIASPDDKAEALFAKAYEYLQSGCEEVWLLFPENKIAIIVLPNNLLIFDAAATISTQTVLKGFAITVGELFA